MGCRLWGCTESDTTEATQQQQQQHVVELAEFSGKEMGNLWGVFSEIFERESE